MNHFCFFPTLQSDTNPRASTYGRSKADPDRKIGHRRVGEGGEITYKKIQTTQIMGAIQLGIQHTVRIICNIYLIERASVTGEVFLLFRVMTSVVHVPMSINVMSQETDLSMKMCV